MEKYQVCTNCVMDTSDKGIIFDDSGVCNHCHYFEDFVAPQLAEKKKTALSEIIEIIKKDGRNRKFDVIMGLSGGADSSFVAYTIKQYNLRVLAVHLDNGWNSEIAVHNIEKCIEWCQANLYTHVIDWEEFKSMQLAYLKASVIDIEALTDHAITAVIYKLARKFDIKYILSGQNSATECIMPYSFGYDKADFKNIYSINKIFGTKKIKTFPYITLFRLITNKIFLKVQTIKVLDYIDYNRAFAIDLMEKEMGWKNYGGKHHESIFTKFYQNHILVKKFGVDKRRPHLSSMICMGLLSREEALEELKKTIYNEDELRKDFSYVATKLNISELQLNEILNNKPVSHLSYPNNNGLIRYLLKFTPSKAFAKSQQTQADRLKKQ